jgi:hypothetical protein
LWNLYFAIIVFSVVGRPDRVKGAPDMVSRRAMFNRSAKRRYAGARYLHQSRAAKQSEKFMALSQVAFPDIFQARRAGFRRADDAEDCNLPDWQQESA